MTKRRTYGFILLTVGLALAILGVATPGPLTGPFAPPLALPTVIIGAVIAAMGAYFAQRKTNP